MSSKKASSKETKPVAKKAPAKKPAEKAPAKKAAAPAKKTAAASAAKKPAKASAKDVKAAKPAPKAVAKSAAKPAAKPAAKKAETKKPAAKPAAKAPAKVAAKPAKVEPKKAEKKAPAKAVKEEPKKVAAKPAKAEPKKVEKKAPAKAVKEEPKKVAAKPVKAEPKKVEKEPKAEKKAPAKAVKEEPKAEEVKVAVAEKKSKGKKDDSVTAEAEVKAVDSKFDYAVLLEGVKKLSKTVMFTEIDEQEDRSNKKKMSSEMKNLEMKPTASIRHKISLAEETQEELTERILKELEEQNLAFEREAASQMCTRCNRNLVSPEFWVDKHLGYCEECAMILKLGQSKEARKVEYQLGGMGDSLDEEDDEIIGPDADDLKEAEEDLAEMGD